MSSVSLCTTLETVLTYITEISQTLGAMADGDLTVTIKREYIGSYAPIKKALLTIIDSLNRSLSEISMAADQRCPRVLFR